MEYKFRTYPEHYLQNSLRVRDFTIRQKVHARGEWYVRASISPTDSKLLQHRLAFLPGFRAREVVSPRWYDKTLLHDCQSCVYHFEKHRGPYSYILYVLSPDRQTLEVFETYEEFGM